MILIFSLSSFCFSFINGSVLAIDHYQPLLFLLSFMGITSFLKTAEIDEHMVIGFLRLFILFSLTHVLIMAFLARNLIIDILAFRNIQHEGMNLAYNMRGILDTSNTFAYQLLLGIMAATALMVYRLEHENSPRKALMELAC
jgi:hypothetical protein